MKLVTTQSIWRNVSRKVEKTNNIPETMGIDTTQRAVVMIIADESINIVNN